MNTLKFRGIEGSIEYSCVDNCFYGKVLGLERSLVSYEGSTIEELEKDFEEAVDCYLERVHELDLEE